MPRLREPRIPPLSDEELGYEIPEGTSRQAPLDRPAQSLNIFRTLAHHPDLARRWGVFGNHVLAKSTLPAREREILILRIGWLCQAEYEWGQHVRIGKQAGLRDAEIERIKQGPDAAGWTPIEAALLRATDELHADAMVTDGTWKVLAESFDTKQLIDVVFTVGQYNLVSMALNTLGVQLDPGVQGF